MKKIVFLMSALVISATMMAEDHVMAATKGSKKATEDAAPKAPRLSPSTPQTSAVKP